MVSLPLYLLNYRIRHEPLLSVSFQLEIEANLPRNHLRLLEVEVVCPEMTLE